MEGLKCEIGANPHTNIELNIGVGVNLRSPLRENGCSLRAYADVYGSLR